MTFKEGTLIGFFDSNGVELAVGDKVKGMMRFALPQDDGWGRDLPERKPTTYEESFYEGTVIYNNHNCSFLFKKAGGYFSFYQFNKLEKV